MSEESRHGDFYTRDMPGFAERVLEYTRGLDREAFFRDGLVYDATVRNIELIGEAATHVPEVVRAEHPEIPWRMAIATRNKLIHGYLGLDEDVLWSIICDDIPELVNRLQVMLAD